MLQKWLLPKGAVSVLYWLSLLPTPTFKNSPKTHFAIELHLFGTPYISNITKSATNINSFKKLLGHKTKFIESIYDWWVKIMIHIIEKWPTRTNITWQPDQMLKGCEAYRSTNTICNTICNSTVQRHPFSWRSKFLCPWHLHKVHYSEGGFSTARCDIEYHSEQVFTAFFKNWTIKIE